MRLRVVGSSGTYPVPGRPASGYIVEQDSTRVWCDTGPGTFLALPVDPDLIDAIVISHRHPDHCSDLLTAFHAWTYRPDPRFGVPVYGPASVWESLTGFLSSDQAEALTKTFDFHPVVDGQGVDLGALSVSFFEVDHSVPAVASRWQAEGKVLFYTGDTGPAGEWRRHVQDVDVFLCEASHQGDPGTHGYPHHLTPSEAGSIAREMAVRRLVLTHIPPHLDPARSVAEAEAVFDWPVTLAVPGQQINV